ncbi:MAG: zf-HC2 domain-containing protein [Firmicutes bacterium]|nr:zf-HC2 domain-containing protein [Bacillota bacterium]MCL5038636.1 zf-HC2 domain-containing protein [Bacillota bacterium]
MNCSLVTALLVPYLDNELEPATRVSIRQHLAGCPSCRRALLTQARRQRRLRGALRPLEPPAELSARIRELLISKKALSSVDLLPSPETLASLDLDQGPLGGQIASSQTMPEGDGSLCNGLEALRQANYLSESDPELITSAAKPGGHGGCADSGGMVWSPTIISLAQSGDRHEAESEPHFEPLAAKLIRLVLSLPRRWPAISREPGLSPAAAAALVVALLGLQYLFGDPQSSLFLSWRAFSLFQEWGLRLVLWLSRFSGLARYVAWL